MSSSWKTFKTLYYDDYTLLNQRCLQWLDHIYRMVDVRIPKDLLYVELVTGSWSSGRPSSRYTDTCKRNMKTAGIKTNTWETAADDDGDDGDMMIIMKTVMTVMTMRTKMTMMTMLMTHRRLHFTRPHESSNIYVMLFYCQAARPSIILFICWSPILFPSIFSVVTSCSNCILSHSVACEFSLSFPDSPHGLPFVVLLFRSISAFLFCYVHRNIILFSQQMITELITPCECCAGWTLCRRWKRVLCAILGDSAAIFYCSRATIETKLSTR